MGKRCQICDKKCSGDILKADGDKYFHIACFSCKNCNRPLTDTGFYTTNDGKYLCPDDFRALATGHHSKNEKSQMIIDTTLINTKNKNGTTPSIQSPIPSPIPNATCAACSESLATGQVLLALEKQWHVWCFKCTECDAVLQGEYMAYEGKPLCIRDYHKVHGVKCYECEKFIAGRVLQAGGYKFHPTCAKCTRCDRHFGEGEEMYMQGNEIWHPACEISQKTENLALVTAGSKTSSISKSTKGPKYQSTLSQHLIYMYSLPDAEDSAYLKQPISPHPPKPPQFHTPIAPIKIRKSRYSMLKTGMQRLTEDLERNIPRAKSPHMDNEEPIEMSHFPAGHAPEPGAPPPIEREDFPAPPYPYAVEELKRRLSSSSIENDDEDDDFVDNDRIDEEKLKSAVEQLDKFEKDSGIAYVIKQNLQESKNKQRLPLHWDPRNASRTPSAKKMPHLKFRYDTPINASPSRHLNRPKPWVFWKEGGVTEKHTLNTLPNFHVPNCETMSKAATLPDGYGYDGYGMSMDHLDTTISSHFSEHSLNSVTLSSHGYPTKGTMMNGGDIRTNLRSSLPDMSKPVKNYKLSELQTTNKELPENVDRMHLERHLCREEFEDTFGMTPIEFYKLPEWKRINLKRKVKLF
ncbi:Zinc finger, LIM-type domain and Villin headpiece domain-containing protein [Strongyloides ratti]|uniref:Zinc finger, LIM-type domain and Villin headpiece domain-containing protein n=1 Tax=Strongyloides ratti TaxID=34506 RepID=A0A090KPM9_STRRB|nr:Zinc finger, LIM-type domain and Villin headpiece domain-containing protein [Strongyloides ratti]CEF59528.1 Zinc finger, LIM-type domain and Villin headpiece domain-containing protein [Strongyloides ratti]